MLQGEELAFLLAAEERRGEGVGYAVSSVESIKTLSSCRGGAKQRQTGSTLRMWLSGSHRGGLWASKGTGELR